MPKIMIIQLENTQVEIVHDNKHHLPQEMPQNSTYWCEHYLWLNAEILPVIQRLE